MIPKSTEQVFELLDAAVTASALGAAMEHNLFWILADGPKEAVEISEELTIPASRCRSWLRLLCSMDLLCRTGDGYRTSALGRRLILDAYSPETWAFLARETRLRFPALADLALHIKEPVSTWEIQGLTPPDYFKALQTDPQYARGFTRMLYEIHLPLAEEVAALLDLSDAKSLLDLGGGSGVMSMALLDRHPGLKATVIDIENVCAAGQELAKERDLDKRMSYQALDYVHETLPKGFDRILSCDAGPHTSDQFKKVKEALRPGGRFVVIDQFSPATGSAPTTRLTWTFLGTLENPDSKGFVSAESVVARIGEAGFHEVSVRDVPHRRDIRWNTGWQVIEAHA